MRGKLLVLVLLIGKLMSSDALVRREVWEFTKESDAYTFLMKRTVKRLGWGAKDFMRTFEMVLPKEYPFRVVRAYTVNSQGRKIDVPSRNLRSFPYFPFFPYFSFLRKYEVVFPEVGVPSESHVEVRGRVQEVLDARFPLLEPYPSLEKRWAFVGFKKVFFHAQGFSPQVMKEPRMGEEATVLRFVNLPPYPHEPLQPRVPSLVVSARQGWGELEAEVKEVLNSEGLKDKFKFPDLSSALEYLKARLKPVRFPLRFSLLYARSEKEVLESGYASPVEMAMVLRAVLRNSGYEPIIYFSAPQDAFSEEVPAISQFDEVGVYVAKPGLYITSDLKPVRFPVDRVLWIFSSTPHFQRTSPIGAEQNLLRVRIRIEGERLQGELEGSGNFVLYGNAPEVGKAYLRKMGISAELQEARIVGNLLTFSALLRGRDNLIRIKPDIGLLPEGAEGFAEDRITPVEFPQPFQVDIKLEILRPGQIIYLPPSKKRNFSMGRFSLEVEKGRESVSLHFSLTLSRRRIPPSEAPRLAELIQLCRSKELTSLIFLPNRF